MKHKIWFDQDYEILRQEVIGAYSSQEARDSGAEYKKSLEGKPYRQLIVDLSQAGKMQDRQTRKITSESLEDADISAVAFVGATAATRMIAKVLMKLGSNKISTDFFKTDSEAVNWLNNKRGTK